MTPSYVRRYKHEMEVCWTTEGVIIRIALWADEDPRIQIIFRTRRGGGYSEDMIISDVVVEMEVLEPEEVYESI